MPGAWSVIQGIIYKCSVYFICSQYPRGIKNNKKGVNKNEIKEKIGTKCLKMVK